MADQLEFGKLNIYELLDPRNALPPNIQLTHEQSDEEFEEFLEEWDSQPLVAADLETAGKTNKKEALDYFRLKVRLIQIGYKGNCFIVDTFKETPERKRKVLNQLKRLVEGTKQTQVFHNGFFDLSILRTQGNIRAKSVRDTMVMAKMLNAGYGRIRPNNLGACVEQFLGIKLDKSHQKDDWAVPYLSNSQYLYAANDVIYTEKLYYEMCKQAKTYSNLDLTGKPCKYSFIDNIVTECEVLPAFVELLATGQPVDLELCTTNIKKYRDAIVDLYQPLMDKLGLPYSAQPAKLHKAIKDVYGINVMDSKDKPTTSSDALFLASIDHGNDDLLRLSLTRSLVKLADTLQNLYDSAMQNNGYARGCYTSLGDKASGRSTCKGGGVNSSLEALNLQNIPGNVQHPMLDKYDLPPMREVIRQPDLTSMYLTDLSSSHARYAASLSGDIKLVEVMEMKDPHSYLTLKLGELSNKGWDLDYYTENKGSDKALGEYRSVAKTALYTQFNGGGGAVFYKNLLKAYIAVDLEICNQAKEALAQAFPVYADWCNMNQSIARQKPTERIGYQNFITYQTRAGRVYHVEVSDRISKKGNPYVSVNAGELSSAELISMEAYAMKKAFTEIYHYLIENPNPGYQLNSFTHDDISITDSTEDKLFAQYTYNRIAHWFTETLGEGVNSTMSPDDGKWSKNQISDYSKK